MAQSPFDDLARDVPDGSFWMDADRWKALLGALTSDRVRAGANLDEHPSDKGRFFNAKAGGTSAAEATTPPLTVEDASEPDAGGGIASPGRVRVYKGRLGNLLPDEMNLVDALLPDGTDNRCYLTCPEGTAYVYGKILVDTSAGLYTSASVYQVDSTEEADGTYLYLLIATVVTTGGVPAVSQEWTGGDWNPAAAASADGSILSPVGT